MSNYNTRMVMRTNVYKAFSVYKGLLRSSSSLVPATTLEEYLQHRKSPGSPEMFGSSSKVATGMCRTEIKTRFAELKSHALSST